MDLQLEGKAAIVTGSSRGLGLASARALAAEGCRVCMCARGAEALEQAAAGTLTGLSPNRCRADLFTPEGAARVVDAAIGAFGAIDILVNNVATAKGTDIVGTPDADWQDALRPDTLSGDSDVAARRAAHAANRRRRHHHDRVDLGRESGGRMVYNAVKAAEISLAKAMAQQLAKDNIRVNSVAPGRFSFPAVRGTSGRRPIPRGSPSSSRQSCRSGASAAPKRSATPSPFCLTACELDQRLMHPSGRLPVALADLRWSRCAFL